MTGDDKDRATTMTRTMITVVVIAMRTEAEAVMM